MSGPTFVYGDGASFMMWPRRVWELIRHCSRDVQVYGELLHRAQYNAGWRSLKNGPVWLDVGDAPFGRDELALKLGLSPNQVRASITTLTKHNIITIRPTDKSTKSGSIAKLLGYGKKSESENAEPPRTPPASPPTNGQQPHQENADNPTTPYKTEKSEKSDKREKLRRGGSPLPSDWSPSVEIIEFGRTLGLRDDEIVEQVDTFKDNALAHGKVCVDWDVALRIWFRRQATWLEEKGELTRVSQNPAHIPIAGHDRKGPQWIPTFDEQDQAQAISTLQTMYGRADAFPSAKSIAILREALDRAEQIGAVDTITLGHSGSLLVRDEQNQQVAVIDWNDLEQRASEAA